MNSFRTILKALIQKSINGCPYYSSDKARKEAFDSEVKMNDWEPKTKCEESTYLAKCGLGEQF
jgi:hypothetical protein